jgi:hypothetical protein
MSSFGFNSTGKMPWQPISLAREIQNFNNVANRGKPRPQQTTGGQGAQQPSRRTNMNGTPAPRRQSQPIQPRQSQPQARQIYTTPLAVPPSIKRGMAAPQQAQQQQQQQISQPQNSLQQQQPQVQAQQVQDKIENSTGNSAETEKICRDILLKGLADQEKSMQELVLANQRHKEDYTQFKHFMTDSTQRHVMLKEELRKFVENLLREKIDRKSAEKVIKDETTKQIQDLQKVMMNEVNALENKRQLLELNPLPVQAQVLGDNVNSYEAADTHSKVVKSDIPKGTWIVLRGLVKEANGHKWQESFEVDSASGQVSRAWVRMSDLGSYKLI